MQSFSILAAAVISISYTTSDTTYRVTEIKREKQYAGKLGYRVRESITVESGGQIYRIRIDGDAHTLHTRPSQMVKIGDKVMFFGRSNPKDGIVRREDIRRVN